MFKNTLIDLFLFLSSSIVFAQQVSRIANLELPLPSKQDVIITHLGYTLSYNEQHEQANWVAYELTAAETQKVVGRSNNFRMDGDIKTGSATNADYKGFGYDRGHLAPAGDMGWSIQAMEESFFYSNMSPQVQGFNRGIWKKLEERVRCWAVDNQSVYVVTGPILKNNLPFIGSNKVSVPLYYYKVILDYSQPELKGIGFILTNASSSLPLQNFAVPIDSVEHITGIDFFPALPDKQERDIEKTICISSWSWTSTSTVHKSHYSPTQVRGGATVQCSAITKAGTRCKRVTSNLSGLCTQHEKMASGS